MLRRMARSVLGTAVLLAGLAGCKESTGPALPLLEVVAVGGDMQYGTTGVDLAEPLVILVREIRSKLPAAEVNVRWTVTSGDAVVVGPDARVTDQAGFSAVRLRMGNVVGAVTLTATVIDRAEASATLRSFLIGAPELTRAVPQAVQAGGTLVLEGSNFSPVPDQNLVYFAGVRGRVVGASATRLEVNVPACLPPRASVGVRVGLGAVLSDSLRIAVDAPPTAPTVAVGAAVDLSDPLGLGCLRLSGEGGARYLVVARSASTLAAARHRYRLTGLEHRPVATAPLAGAPLRLGAGTTEAGVGPAGAELSAQEAFEARLREEEDALVAGRSTPLGPLEEGSGPQGAPLRAVTVGESKPFWVYNGADDPNERFDQVTATVRHVGQHAVIYVDEQAPANGFTAADLQAIGARFDQVIHPTVTGVFGAPSDLDRNQKIAILFTPVVNRLTPRGSNSFVGGFFYGRDLLPELSSSNKAEVFYALVPDPLGVHSDVRTRQMVMGAVPSILAHEFQHMIHFNQRVLRADGSQDALWMLEGLAQMAEELVARAYDLRAAPLEAELFRDGNRRRVRLYLDRPDTVSLIVSSGRGTLAERGAGFLFLLHLHQHEGADLLRRLTRSTRTGVQNVVAEVGRGWDDVIADWTTAVYLDGTSLGTGRWSYAGFDLRDFLGGPFPIRPWSNNPGDFSLSSEIASSSMRYIVLTPPQDGTLTVGFGGGGGGAHGAGSGMVLRVIRLQ